jgi:hypothetical protein
MGRVVINERDCEHPVVHWLRAVSDDEYATAPVNP